MCAALDRKYTATMTQSTATLTVGLSGASFASNSNNSFTGSVTPTGATTVCCM